MDTTPEPKKQDTRDQAQHKHDGFLKRLFRKIEPTSHEIGEQELHDPGKMTPGADPTDNRS